MPLVPESAGFCDVADPGLCGTSGEQQPPGFGQSTRLDVLQWADAQAVLERVFKRAWAYAGFGSDCLDAQALTQPAVDGGFDPSGLSDGEKKALVQAISDGDAMLAAKSASMGKQVNGWQLSPVLDEYFGTDYLFRAAIGYQAMFVIHRSKRITRAYSRTLTAIPWTARKATTP